MKRCPVDDKAMEAPYVLCSGCRERLGRELAWLVSIKPDLYAVAAKETKQQTGPVARTCQPAGAAPIRWDAMGYVHDLQSLLDALHLDSAMERDMDTVWRKPAAVEYVGLIQDLYRGIGRIFAMRRPSLKQLACSRAEGTSSQVAHLLTGQGVKVSERAIRDWGARGLVGRRRGSDGRFVYEVGECACKVLGWVRVPD